MDLLSVVYVSSAVTVMSDQALDELLHKARAANQQRRITGMLLHAGGNFLQVIEGPEQSVQDLYEKIHTDARHRGVLRLMQVRTTERHFAEWSMAFRRISGSLEDALPGYSSFLETKSGNAPVRSSRLDTLLRTFRHNMIR